MLRKLPNSTFGNSYVRFMDLRGFSPDSRREVKLVDDPQLAYVMQRYREVHDFWHILAGMETTVLSEIGVKWFEFIQTGLPLCAFSATFGPLTLSWHERQVLITKIIPWAIRCGNNSTDLLNVWYENHFSQDLDDFRHTLKFEPFINEHQNTNTHSPTTKQFTYAQ